MSWWRFRDLNPGPADYDSRSMHSRPQVYTQKHQHSQGVSEGHRATKAPLRVPCISGVRRLPRRGHCSGIAPPVKTEGSSLGSAAGRAGLECAPRFQPSMPVAAGSPQLPRWRHPSLPAPRDRVQSGRTLQREPQHPRQTRRAAGSAHHRHGVPLWRAQRPAGGLSECSCALGPCGGLGGLNRLQSGFVVVFAAQSRQVGQRRQQRLTLRRRKLAACDGIKHGAALLGQRAAGKLHRCRFLGGPQRRNCQPRERSRRVHVARRRLFNQRFQDLRHRLLDGVTKRARRRGALRLSLRVAALPGLPSTWWRASWGH